MTNQTPLNPDALAQAKAAAVDCRISGCTTEDVAECAVEAYLAVAQPEVNSDKASTWDEGFKAGWEEAKDPGAFVNDYWDSKTPNPYR